MSGIRENKARAFRRTAGACAALLSICFLTMAGLLFLGKPLLAAPPASEPAKLVVSTPRAIVYQRNQRILMFSGLIWSLAGMGALLGFKVSHRLRDTAQRTAPRSGTKPGSVPPTLISFCLFFILFRLVMAVWNLPTAAGSYALERYFGFAQQTPIGLIQDYGLEFLLGLPVGLLIWGAILLFAAKPKTWWLWAWGGLIPLVIFFSLIHPLLISPLFNRYTLLADGPLRTNILSLAKRAGIPKAQVLVEDTSRRTSKVNAYVTGIGPSARIVLNDTALHTLPDDQILAMTAHEIGHYVHRDVWVLLIGNILGAGIILWLAYRLLPGLLIWMQNRFTLQGPLDLAGLPGLVLALNLVILIQYPLASAESRWLEHRADVYGLQLSGLNEPTAALMEGFVRRDMSDPNPPALLQFWFGSHPTLHDRILLARSFSTR